MHLPATPPITTDDVIAAVRQVNLSERALTTIRAAMPAAPSPADFEAAEARLFKLPQVECPLEHRFAPGIYLREITMPAGAFVIGAQHNTEHFNVVLSGRAFVMIEGEIKEMAGPMTFVSKPGVRKVLYIAETMRWQTIHLNPGDETDLERLEKMLVTRTPTDLAHRQQKREALCQTAQP